MAIPFSQNVKDLGLHTDNTRSWHTQDTSVCQKVTGRCGRLKKILPSATKERLVQTLTFPITDYADVCYYDLNADLINAYLPFFRQKLIKIHIVANFNFKTLRPLVHTRFFNRRVC